MKQQGYLQIISSLRGVTLLIVLGFLVIFGLAFRIAYQQYRHAIDQTVKGNSLTAKLLSTIVQEHQKAAIAILQSYGKHPQLITAFKKRDLDEMVEELTEIKDANPEIDMLIVSDKEGVLWANLPVYRESHGKDFSHRDWYKGVSKGWTPYVSSLYKQVIGEKNLAAMVCVPVFDEAGKVLGILGTTQRTIFVGNLVKNLGFDPDLIITLIDQEGKIAHDSKLSQMREIIHYPHFTLLKKGIEEGNNRVETEILQYPDGPRYTSFVAIRGIGWIVIVQQESQKVLQSISGYFLWVGVISALLFTLITFLLLNFRKDIIRQTQEEERMRSLNEELENKVQERTAELEAFSYSVSHDLRAPLRAIDGFSRIILEDYLDKLDDEGKRFLNTIQDNTQKMGKLIDDLLAFSRSGRQEMNLSAIDMAKLAKGVFEEIKPPATQRNFQFNIQTLPIARGDHSLMKQVLVNYLSNAIKFTKPKETAVIEVRGWSEENENIYYVKDNGVGFDMQYAGKLFGVFQRLHSSEEFEGTGVGLAIVQRIIHRHGGGVWAEGKVNEGAIFYFTLPRGMIDER